jgi:hypothetical protein
MAMLRLRVRRGSVLCALSPLYVQRGQNPSHQSKPPNSGGKGRCVDVLEVVFSCGPVNCGPQRVGSLWLGPYVSRDVLVSNEIVPEILHTK